MENLKEHDIAWEAPEHHHIEKSNDWYWAVGIVALAGAVAAIVFGNLLFGVVILLGAAVLAVVASRRPEIVLHVVGSRGIRIGDETFPYSTLKSFHIDEEDPRGPQLLIRTNQVLHALLVLPLPEDAVDDIEYVLEERLPKEHIEEPLGHKVLEFFGF